MTEKIKHGPRSWLSEQILVVLHRAGIESFLEEGLELVRKGKVLDFTVQAGKMRAKIQGERYSPFLAEISLATISESNWKTIFSKLSSNAFFFAKLLAGELPEEIRSVFAEVGVDLFPHSPQVLSLCCSCGAQHRPCVHLAALYFTINEKFYSNPFLIFTLRGKNKAEMLAELRRLRQSHGQGAVVKQHGQVFVAGSYEAPQALVDKLDHYWSSGEKLKSVRFTIRADELPAAILKQLSPIPVAQTRFNVDTALEDSYAYIANRAQAFGLGLIKTGQ